MSLAHPHPFGIPTATNRAPQDIWSLGVTLFELVAGDPPLASLRPMTARGLLCQPGYRPTLAKPKRWSERLRDFLATCTREDPETRPSSDVLLGVRVSSVESTVSSMLWPSHGAVSSTGRPLLDMVGGLFSP